MSSIKARAAGTAVAGLGCATGVPAMPHPGIGRRRTPQGGQTRVAQTATLTFLLTTAQLCLADDVRWANPAGGSFSHPGNWDAGRVPGAGDRAIIELEGTYIVNLDANVTIGGLTLGGQSGTQTLAMDEPRTIDLISQPVLVRENGVFRFRGTARNAARFDNHGTVVLRSATVGGEGIIYPSLDLVNHADGLVRVEGGVQFIGYVVNHGAMELTSAAPEGPMYLTAENLRNNGRIDVLRSEGGLRRILSPLENSSSATLFADISLELAEPVVNHGTIEVMAGGLECEVLITDGTVRLPPGQTLTLSGLTYDGGELGGPGTTIALVEPAGRYTLNADLFIAPDMTLTVQGANTTTNNDGRVYNAGRIGLVNGGRFKLTNQRGGTVELGSLSSLWECHNLEGGLVRFVATNSYGFSIRQGELRNEGVFEITSESTAPEIAITLFHDVTVINTGLIQFSGGPHGSKFVFLGDEIQNLPEGRIEVATDVELEAEPLLNQGTIEVAGAALAMSANAINLQDPNGRFIVTDGLLRLGQGSVALPAVQLEMIRSTLALSDVTLTLASDTDTLDAAFALYLCTVNGPGRLINSRALSAAYCSLNTSLVNRSGAEMTLSGSTHVNGDLSNEAGGLITITNTIDIQGALTNSANGTLRIFGRDFQDAKLVLKQPFVNDGAVQLLSGRASLSATLRAEAGLINNGALRLASRGPAVVRVPDGGFVNHGDIRILPSPGPHLDPPRRIEAPLHNASDGVVTVQSDATIGLPGAGPVNDGRIAVNGCALDTHVADFLNRGQVEITEGGALLAGGPYVQTAGATLLSNGILGGTEVRIEGGDLAGVGAVAPMLINGGRVAPGSPIGRIDVAGHYIQTTAGLLDVELAGRDPGEYDSLAVSGAAVLDGRLRVALSGGFEPTAGDEFAILTTADRRGRFTSQALPCLAPLSRMSVVYSPAEVTLTVEPPLTGDLNCDCTADAFDIEPFVLALTDPGGYGAAYPDCDINLADLNGDGRVDAADIEPFIERLLE